MSSSSPFASPSGEAAAPLDRVLTVDALVASITRMAFEGQIEPGTALRENELADHFSVGRHSVRAALQALASDGIAVYEPHRGVFLRTFSATDIEDMYVLRMALETEAVRRIHEQGIGREAVDVALSDLATMADGNVLSELVRGDLQIHRAIVAEVRSGQMLRAFDSVQRELRLALGQARMHYQDGPALYQQHQVLLDDIWRLPLAEAQDAIRAHDLLAIDDVKAAH